MSETITYFDTRWICPKCSRFIKESSITSINYLDDSEYYGVRTEIFGQCKQCGEVPEPRVIPLKEITIKMENEE